MEWLWKKKCVRKCPVWGRLKDPQKTDKRVLPKCLSEATTGS